MFDLLIQNALVVNHDGSSYEDIAVKNGLIAEAAPYIPADKAARLIDASGLCAFPGFIDPHVHIGYPDRSYLDDLIASTNAAAAGGVTTLIDFVAEDNSLIEQLDETEKLIPGNACVDIAYHAGIYTEEHVSEMPECARRGMTSFKLYLPFREKDAPESYHLTDEKLSRILSSASRMGSPAIATFHAENIYAGSRDPQAFQDEHPDASWDTIRPGFCEASDLKRMADLAAPSGCPLYMVHTSAKESVALLEQLRSEGVSVMGETCAHYLLLTAENSDRELSKINPPIRHQADVDALWAGICSGAIRTIGSDHSSCSIHHKKPFKDGIPGFAGIQTTLPVLMSEGVRKGRISMENLAEIFSYNTAKVFGLYPRKGVLAPGADADITLVDPGLTKTVHAEELEHISDYTPFEGLELTGWPVMTFLRGQKVFDHGKVCAEDRRGQYILRTLDDAK